MDVFPLRVDLTSVRLTQPTVERRIARASRLLSTVALLSWPLHAAETPNARAYIDPMVPPLVVAFQSTDTNRRANAAWDLSIKGKAAVPFVLELARTSRDDGLRTDAIRLLGRIGKPAIPSLIRMMDEPNDLLRREAMYSLGRMQAKEALPKLLKALDQKRPYDRNAMEALGYFGPEARAAVPVLLRALAASPNDDLTVVALGKIGPAAAPAIPSLMQSLATTPHKHITIEALGRIGPKASAAVPMLMQYLHTKRGTECIYRASGHLTRIVGCEVSAATALGDIGLPSRPAVPLLAKLLEEVPEPYSVDIFPNFPESMRPELQEAAARALEKINTPDSWAAARNYRQKMGMIEIEIATARQLNAMSLWNSDPFVRFYAVLRHADESPYLLLPSLADPDYHVRAAATVALSRSDAAPDIVVWALQRKLRDPLVADHALIALDRIQNARWVQNSGTPPIRLATLKNLWYGLDFGGPSLNRTVNFVSLRTMGDIFADLDLDGRLDSVLVLQSSAPQTGPTESVAVVLYTRLGPRPTNSVSLGTDQVQRIVIDGLRVIVVMKSIGSVRQRKFIVVGGELVEERPRGWIRIGTVDAGWSRLVGNAWKGNKRKAAEINSMTSEYIDNDAFQGRILADIQGLMVITLLEALFAVFILISFSKYMRKRSVRNESRGTLPGKRDYHQ